MWRGFLGNENAPRKITILLPQENPYDAAGLNGKQ
jgi:hypothetical protein